jgi:hypothetical protein
MHTLRARNQCEQVLDEIVKKNLYFEKIENVLKQRKFNCKNKLVNENENFFKEG